MKYLREYAARVKKYGLAFFLCCFTAGCVAFLYGIPAEPVIYGGILCTFIMLLFFWDGYRKYVRKKEMLQQILSNSFLEEKMFPEPLDETERLYQEIVKNFNSLRMKAEGGKRRFYEELTDYYTMWVHQIKTPISALRLLLQENKEENKAALSELFKIEQYVEMVLGYLRTEDISADMSFQEYDLDGLIKEQIHKYARIFVGKKLTLHYEGVEEHVLTDGKWLGFVIGQIFSNALKYTKQGGISVYMSPDRAHTLVIEDTGIGIRPEDLPRVFEKGFTGHNGREDNRSTGIGLYLCVKIMKKLNHEITIESTPGKGTKVYLFLGRKALDMY